MVQFDAGKMEAALLTCKCGQELKDQIQQAEVEIADHHVPFNLEATPLMAWCLAWF